MKERINQNKHSLPFCVKIVLEYSLIATFKNYQASRSGACVIRPPPGEVGTKRHKNISYILGSQTKIGIVYILETKTKVTSEAINPHQQHNINSNIMSTNINSSINKNNVPVQNKNKRNHFVPSLARNIWTAPNIIKTMT